jgi:hypothetical protein
VLKALDAAPAAVAAAARAEIEAVLGAGAYHNKEYAEFLARKWAAELK